MRAYHKATTSGDFEVTDRKFAHGRVGVATRGDFSLKGLASKVASQDSAVAVQKAS
jgi:hypothetical protein